MFSLKAKEQLLCKHKIVFSTSPKSHKIAQWGKDFKSHPIQPLMPFLKHSPTPSPLSPLLSKGGLGLHLSTSAVRSSLGNLFALHLQLIWHQQWAQLSAKSFANISLDPHPSPGRVIIPILQFRKLRLPACPKSHSDEWQGLR